MPDKHTSLRMDSVRMQTKVHHQEKVMGDTLSLVSSMAVDETSSSQTTRSYFCAEVGWNNCSS